MRLRVVPQSTKIFVTNNSPSSALRSFFCSQLAIAERNSFSTLAEASLEENFKTPSALFTSIPRIISATKRILRGEVGTFCNFAKYMVFRASFLFSAEILFLAPIYLVFFIISDKCLLFFLITCMSTECTCRGKLAQLVTYHVFSNINRDKFISVMNCDCMPNEIRRNH